MKVNPAIQRFLLCSTLTAIFLILVSVAGLALYLSPRLPAVDVLRNMQLQTPLRIYSADKKLIAEFGEKRRTPIAIDDVPEQFIQAIKAAEDDGFEHHHGVDIKGLIRASLQLLTTGSIQTGGSTITMQVAKNYFLTRERTFSRKFNEILLALQIEQELSKDEIMELYVNKIYLGNRAYGIQAAAQVYYGQNIGTLRLSQLAMIAGLPKAPSAFNPLANPERALIRRNWILGRMLQLNYIDQSAYDSARAEPVSADFYGLRPELEAPYVAEMVRTRLLEQYPEDQVYTAGLRVYTTVESSLQEGANRALQEGLLAYDRRHGYRGIEGHYEFATTEPVSEAITALGDYRRIGLLHPAIVIFTEGQSFSAVLPDGEQVMVHWDNMKWARPYITTNSMGPRPKTAGDIVKAGDIIRLRQVSKGDWGLAQLPIAQSAFVALSPQNGSLLALVGGFNFQQSNFNRVTQAARQPGSNFKPFVYAAALANGYTAASIINDAPVVFDDDLLESAWRPENYSGKFYGPTRLRKALYQSRNLVSIRLLRALGINDTINYVQRFGFEKSQLPRDLSLALGSAEFTPYEIVEGYAVFANGGYKVEPYFIDYVENNEGEILFKTTPYTVCPECTTTTPGRTLEEEPNGNVETSMTSLEQALALAVEEELSQAAVMPGQTDNSAADEDHPTRPEINKEVTEIEIPNISYKVLAAPRVLEARVAYIVNSIMRDVVNRGTGRRALQLGRSDLAGKTGTTNDQKDAWFSGYNGDVVAAAWVGFDQPQTLGKREVGGYAALPIWIDFMRTALKGRKETRFEQPSDLVSVRIDPATGKRAQAGQPDAIFELFRVENVPEEELDPRRIPSIYGQEEAIPEQLF